MAEISWTEEAERWLRDIYEYIASDNPTAAAEVVNGIYQHAQQLTEFPELGYRLAGGGKGSQEEDIALAKKRWQHFKDQGGK